jgi:hypothetical protein
MRAKLHTILRISSSSAAMSHILVPIRAETGRYHLRNGMGGSSFEALHPHTPRTQFQGDIGPETRGCARGNTFSLNSRKTSDSSDDTGCFDEDFVAKSKQRQDASRCCDEE